MRKLLPALAMCVVAAAARADCTITTGSLAFGTYDVFSPTPLDSLATITYSCSAVAAPVMSIDRGGAPTFTPRQMKSGTSALSYNLYVDAARTQVWGDGSAGTTTYACSLGTGLSAPVYGRIFAQQNLPVGTYTDTLIITVMF